MPPWNAIGGRFASAAAPFDPGATAIATRDSGRSETVHISHCRLVGPSLAYAPQRPANTTREAHGGGGHDRSTARRRPAFASSAPALGSPRPIDVHARSPGRDHVVQAGYGHGQQVGRP